eukprot:gene13821-biopygen5302
MVGVRMRFRKYAQARCIPPPPAEPLPFRVDNVLENSRKRKGGLHHFRAGRWARLMNAEGPGGDVGGESAEWVITRELLEERNKQDTPKGPQRWNGGGGETGWVDCVHVTAAHCARADAGVGKRAGVDVASVRRRRIEQTHLRVHDRDAFVPKLMNPFGTVSTGALYQGRVSRYPPAVQLGAGGHRRVGLQKARVTPVQAQCPPLEHRIQAHMEHSALSVLLERQESGLAAYRSPGGTRDTTLHRHTRGGLEHDALLSVCRAHELRDGISSTAWELDEADQPPGSQAAPGKRLLLN